MKALMRNQFFNNHMVKEHLRGSILVRSIRNVLKLFPMIALLIILATMESFAMDTVVNPTDDPSSTQKPLSVSTDPSKNDETKRVDGKATLDSISGASNVVENTAPSFGFFDITTVSYAGIEEEFSVKDQESDPRGLAFSTDGMKLFIIGESGDAVVEYHLSSAYDVSTAVYAGAEEEFSVRSQESDAQSVAFSSDGTKMFIVGFGTDDVVEYHLDTVFDVSTAVYAGSAEEFRVRSEDSSPRGVTFNADGTKMFITGATGEDIIEYDLGTAFDVSTAVYAGALEEFALPSNENYPQEMAFSSDGLKMYTIGSERNEVTEYKLASAYDVSTAVYSGIIDVSSEESTSSAIAFASDGSKMFVLGFAGDAVVEYTMGFQPSRVSVEENFTGVVLDANARNGEGGSSDVGITYTITGGADQNLFSINSSTGELTLDSPLDFENPSDSNTDNVYEVQIQADNGGIGNNTAVLNFKLTVTNVDEFISITSTSPSENALNITSTTSIAITFDVDVNASTLNSSNIRIRGQQSGPIEGTWSASGTVATFNPTSGLVDGEVIHIDVSSNIRSAAGGVLTTEKSYSFTVAPKAPLLGKLWEAASSIEVSNWFGVTYGNGRFVAVADYGTNRAMYSDDGETWTAVAATEANQWRSVTYGKTDGGTNRFVAVSISGTNQVMYSENGETWTAASAAESNQWWSVTYGKGRFVAVATNGTNPIMYSDDGENWSSASAPEGGNSWRSVTYGNGRFVAVAASGNNRVMYSDDGITWTASSAAASTSWNSVTYGNGRFVAVAIGGATRAMYSVNGGETWTVASEEATQEDWTSVTYGNGRFVAVSAIPMMTPGTNRVMYSEDGDTWTGAPGAGSMGSDFRSITYGNGRFVAVSFMGTQRVMYTITPLELASSSPASNATNIASDADIALTFTLNLDATTITSSNIIVRGEQSGNISGSWSVTGAVATFSPTEDLIGGEVVHVELSTNISSNEGISLSSEIGVSFTVNPEPPFLGENWVKASAAEANGWRSVTYGNGRFVAVAQSGTNRVMYSDDGETWTAAAAPEANTWISVTYGNGRFVAVATDGTNRVMYSDDGETWTAAPAAGASGWVSVTYGNGRFVAVANFGSNRVMYSDDGATWTAAPVSGVSQWVSVTYGNGRFVAVANFGTNRVIYSDDGATWTTAPATEANQWYSVTYGNGRFVAVAWNGTNQVMYSEDGETWTAAPTTEASEWRSVTYGNGRFVAVATKGTNQVMYSEDGASWTAATAAEANGWWSVTYGNGRYVAVAATGTNRVMVSKPTLKVVSSLPAANATNISAGTNIELTFDSNVDATSLTSTNIIIRGQQSGMIAGSWTATGATATFNPTNDLTAGEVIHVEVGSGVKSSNGAKSENSSYSFTVTPANNDGLGENWMASDIVEANLWSSVTYGNGRYVAVAITGTNRIMYSDNGKNWTETSAPEANQWRSVTYGNGRFVATASSGTNRVMYSDDGINWTATTAPSSSNWFGVTYGNSRFVAVALSGGAMYSDDGVNWVAATGSSTGSWHSVTYGNGRFVAVAEKGANQVMYSEDGNTWTLAAPAEYNEWRSVTYGNGLFVAVASYETFDIPNGIMYSSDGETWTSGTLSGASFTNNWYAVTYGNGLFVAVSRGGEDTTNQVMISEDGMNWTRPSGITAAYNNNWFAITYGNDRFVAVAQSGTNRVMHSIMEITVSSVTPAANATDVDKNSNIELTFDSNLDATTLNSTSIVVRGQESGNIAGTWSVEGAVATFDPTSNLTAGEVIHVEISENVQSSGGVSAQKKALSFTVSPADAKAGSEWTTALASEANQWRSVTYGNGRFVAVADIGTNRVMYSDDGTTWTAAQATEVNSWFSVTYGNGRFVAVATNGTNRVMYSEDGATWTAATAGEASPWQSVTYGNGRFVAVAGSGTNQVMHSEDGATWTSATAADASGWVSVTYGNGRFVAVANFGSNHVMYSEDGVTWTAAAATEVNSWRSVTYGNGRFVAVAQNGTNQVMHSEDGATWTAATAADASGWVSVTYGNGRFVAVAANGANQVMHSEDGVTWTAAPAGEASSWFSVTYGNGRFVAVAFSGINRVMVSTPPLPSITLTSSTPTANATNVDASSNIALTFSENLDSTTVNTTNIVVRGQQSGSLAGTWSVEGAVATFDPTSNLTAGEVIHVEISENVQSSGGASATKKALSFTVSPSDTKAGSEWTAAPAAEASEWRSVTYGNGRFVAVAYLGTKQVMHSDDGLTWTAATAAEANSWYSVTFGNGRFVAVANGGTNRVMYSDDGATWTAAAAAEANSWQSVTYGNGRFVAVSYGGTNRVMYSDDGATWTAAPATEANGWSNVTFGNGRFVAVAVYGTNRVMYSDNGETWTAVAATEANQWTSATYGNGRFVAVAKDGTNRVMYSDNGETWTAATAAEANQWQSVSYGNGRFVTIAQSGTNRVMYSDDGATWTAAPAAESNFWLSVTYGNGRFVAVSQAGTNRVMVSTASTSELTLTSSTPTANATNIATNAAVELTFSSTLNASTVNASNITVRGQLAGSIAGTWSVEGAVATFTPTQHYLAGDVIHVEISTNVASTSGAVLASTEGLSFTATPQAPFFGSNWTAVPAAENNDWFGLAYGNGRFVAVSTSGTNRVMYSDDGESWTSSSAPEANEWRSVTYGKDRFVALSTNGTNRVMHSTDGATWTSAALTEESTWRSITYGKGRFVGVATSGTHQVMYSDDGETWTMATSAEANTWWSVTYGNGRFVAVSSDGTNQVMYSDDGETWTAASTPEDNFWFSVVYGNGRFVAIARTGANSNLVMYSSDGETWTLAPAASTDLWRSVTYGNGRFVAVSESGTIRAMVSADGATWTMSEPTEQNQWYSVAYGNGRFVATGISGTNRVMITPKAETSEVTITGTAGWRMLSSPKSGFTVADISDNTAIQGVTGGENPDFPVANVYTFGTSGAWSVPASISTPLEDGYGFIVKFFNNDQAGSRPLPLTLDVTGLEPEGDVTVALNKAQVTTGTPEQGSAYYTLLGNPYASNLRLNGLTANGDGALGATYQVWDHAAEDYEVLTGETGIVAPWQGFWVWVTSGSTATEATIANAAKTTDAPNGSYFKALEVIEGQFTLHQGAWSSKPFTLTLREEAEEGLDRFDAAKLTPLSPSYAIVGGRQRQGGSLRALEALPRELSQSLEMVVEPVIVGKEGEMELQWNGFEGFPAEYTVRLTDLVTGERYDVREAGSISFFPTAQKATNSGVNETPVVMEAGTERFILSIEGVTTSSERELQLPSEVELSQNYPNPFNPSTQLQFGLPEASQVRLSVYDMLGREVVQLVNKPMSAGRHTLRFDASGLTSGVYIYRLEADGLVLTRKMTLIK